MSENSVIGPGDLTVADGILVVDAINGGTTIATPRAFTLARPVVADPFQYLLFRGGSAAGASDDWFLRSSLQPLPPFPSRSQSGSSRSTGTGGSVLSPGGLALCCHACAAVIYGRDIIDALHGRMGGDAQLLRPGQDNTPVGGWGRLLGHWGHKDGDPRGIYGSAGPEFD